jgi:prevent-host-death family protein
METVNIHEAKTHLSRLIAKVAKGESFIIAVAGKPTAKVVPIEETKSAPRVFGSLEGAFSVPEDFDSMGRKEIEDMLGLGE